MSSYLFCVIIISFSHWSSIASGNRTPTLAPTVCAQENTHEMPPKKEAWKGATDRRLISSGRSSGPRNSHLTTNFQRALSSDGTSHKTLRTPVSISNPCGGASPEHLRAKHWPTNPASRDRSSRRPIARLGRRDRSNHRE
jgi:hypothetical protein